YYNANGKSITNFKCKRMQVGRLHRHSTALFKATILAQHQTIRPSTLVQQGKTRTKQADPAVFMLVLTVMEKSGVVGEPKRVFVRYNGGAS
ncbi:MAG TPA: hypothetical protein PKK90_02900, partial [Anaerolineaceae bacterium]|nr:hypothetical protein [Anaerolineaceae bacterium]